jgi:6-phosphogluconolactonase (cycloisomerase 2 family)
MVGTPSVKRPPFVLIAAPLRFARHQPRQIMLGALRRGHSHRVRFSERRGNTLTVFDLRGKPGALRRQESIDTEEQPRSFAIDPRGGWLVLAGEKSHHAIVNAIDPSTGSLAARGRYPVGAKPTWVTIAELH